MSWRAEDLPGPNEAGAGILWVPNCKYGLLPATDVIKSRRFASDRPRSLHARSRLTPDSTSTPACGQCTPTLTQRSDLGQWVRERRTSSSFYTEQIIP
jgi:hypothetical protein